ncbi:MAG: ABC transporter permease [Polyangiaceae bacterium]
MGAFFVGVLLALRAIRRNGLRASLTVLGILIGVAAVVTVTALGAGARESVGSQIASLGSNMLIIIPQDSNASGARSATGARAKLTEDDGRAIGREAVSVASYAPTLRARGQLVYIDKNTSTQIIGSTTSFFTVRNWNVEKGSLWTEYDEAAKTKVIVIGSTVKKDLFGEQDPVGRQVRIGRYAYRVLGVLESKGEAPFGGDQDNIVLMPIASMRARILRTPPGQAGMILASATSIDTTDRAVAQVTSILKQRHKIPDDREPDFAIRTQKEFQAMQDTIYSLLTVLLVCVAAISLVVGGIGVMNIMLVSVTERTREIGIRMAIGAREGDIRTQFLVEAVALSLIGGILGTVAGGLAIYGLSSALEWKMGINGTALALALGTSGLTGVVFGFFPARRASRLDPIHALRHE